METSGDLKVFSCGAPTGTFLLRSKEQLLVLTKHYQTNPVSSSTCCDYNRRRAFLLSHLGRILVLNLWGCALAPACDFIVD